MSDIRLIIDACIVSSSGEQDALLSKECRKVLMTIFDKGYSVVLCEKLCDEWRAHGSKFSKSWRKSMKERNRLSILEINPDLKLREKIFMAPSIERDQFILKIVSDDIHLIELALATDKRIISTDDQVRNHLKSASKTVEEIKVILWANPLQTEENVIYWLENGAPEDENRTIGFIVPPDPLMRNGHRIKRMA